MFKNNTINMHFTQSILQQLQTFSLETKSGVKRISNHLMRVNKWQKFDFGVHYPFKAFV